MQARSTSSVRDVMSGETPLTAEVVCGAAFELLVGLYATATPNESRRQSWAPSSASECPPATRRAIAAVGDHGGEAWLHLLGLALELEPVDAGAFTEAVEQVDAVELRRHLLGVYVPSWCDLVGTDVLERAAAGDTTVYAQLLDHPRYYGGRALDSLSRLLPLSAPETKERLTTALRTFGEEVLAPQQSAVIAELERDARQKTILKASLTAEGLIDNAARGYVYEREPRFTRVVLIPHLAARPWLLLCQHSDARVICYPAADEEPDPERAREQRLLDLGRALGDGKRVAMLRRLEQADATLQELADEVGLAKSTTHHHLGQLRAARLIALRGNASGYRYTLDPTGFVDAERLLSTFRFPDQP
jgi:DNA-binding transcriptional ArsR family regulator